MEEETGIDYAESRRIVAAVVLFFTNTTGDGLARIAKYVGQNLMEEDTLAVDLASKGEAFGEALNEFSRAAFALVEDDPGVVVKTTHLDLFGDADDIPVMTQEQFEKMMRDISGTGSDAEEA